MWRGNQGCLCQSDGATEEKLTKCCSAVHYVHHVQPVFLQYVIPQVHPVSRRMGNGYGNYDHTSSEDVCHKTGGGSHGDRFHNNWRPNNKIITSYYSLGHGKKYDLKGQNMNIYVKLTVLILMHIFHYVQQTGRRVFSPWLQKEEHFYFSSLWPVQSWVSGNAITCIISAYNLQNACMLFMCHVSTCSANLPTMKPNEHDYKDMAKKLVCYLQPQFSFPCHVHVFSVSPYFVVITLK